MKKALKFVFIAIFILSITVLTLGSCDMLNAVIGGGDKKCTHEWGEWKTITEADCVNPGTAERECSLCQEIEKKDIPAVGHTESDWIVDKEATCVEGGSKYTECTVCETVISTETILATGEHTESDWIIDEEATCLDDGTKHTKCTICEVTISTETILATEEGHKYENYNCIYCGLTSVDCFEFTYLPESDSYSIKAKSSSSLPNEVILPSSFDGKPVTSIVGSAFYRCDSITGIVMPDSVTSIGNYAFMYCSNLANVVIPDSVTIIGNSAFYVCEKLTTVMIGNGVITIGNEAFYGCRILTNVTIGNNVTTIGNSAFYNCERLTSVVIPASVKTIGDYAFDSCKKLASIDVDENNQYFKSIDGNLYSKNGKTLIQYAKGKKDTTFEVPDSVTYINDYAFSGCTSLTSVVISDSVKTISKSAFYGCINLTNVIIGDGVTTIGKQAFYDCERLTSVVIGGSVTSIDDLAFASWCNSLENIYYNGTEAEWDRISISSNNDYLNNVTLYYYSESEPNEDGNFWHWVDGEVVVWN